MCATPRLGADTTDADDGVSFFRDERAAALDVANGVAPLFLPRLRLEALGLGNLDLELLPELTHHGLVGDRRAADDNSFAHPGNRSASSR